MKRPRLKLIAGLTVLAGTIAAFIYYFVNHPEVGQQLRQISPGLLLGLLALYCLSIIVLALITVATVRLCRLRLETSESLLLTMYTALVNFFGPLQSGPAFRAVYLKQKHRISLKDYAVATLVYYFFFGGLSAALLLSGLLKWWLLPLALVGLGAGYWIIKKSRLAPRFRQLDLPAWYLLALATSLQVIVMTAIYYTELRSVAPGVSLAQAMVYTGAANLALFVSLTPGAIGFRESFLVFSQDLHHISGTTIVTANILDRAVYVIFLLLLALFILATHTRRRLSVTNTEKVKETTVL